MSDIRHLVSDSRCMFEITKTKDMKTLIDTVKNKELSFGERMTAVLIIHSIRVHDEFSIRLNEIEIHEGGSVTTDFFRNDVTISGDNGIIEMSQIELLHLTEETRSKIQEGRI